MMGNVRRAHKGNAASMTEQARQMVLGWLAGDHSPEQQEEVARWMRDTLRIKPIASARAMIREAIQNQQLAPLSAAKAPAHTTNQGG